MSGSITWTRPMLKRFKIVYSRHVAHSDHGVFIFDGHEFDTGYAKYLIEYLETLLSKE